MPLGDPQIDPALQAQLADPWSWVPPHWNEAPVEQAPPQAPVTVEPPAEFPPPAGLPPPVDAELAGNPALPPPELAAPGPTVADLPDFTVGYEPPAPIPPPVDAIAGGAPPTPSTPTPEQAYRQAVTAHADNPLTITDPAQRQRALNELAQRDPQKFAEVMLRHDDERKKFIDARRAEVINRDYDEQIANLKARQEADRITQQKTQELLADSQRLSKIGIDPSGGVKGMRRIAGVLQSIIGGLVQGKTGAARNAGLDAFIDTVNRGIEAQKADLANQRADLGFRRSMFADEFARHGDAFHAAEALRLASYKHADDLLAAEQQNFDPQGTQGLKIATMRAGIAAEQQKGVQAYQQKRFENELKLQDAARQQQVAEQTALHNRQQIGLGYAQLKSAAEDRKLQRQARAEDKAAERADKAAERQRQFAIGGIPKVRVGADGQPVMGPDGKPAIDYDVLRNGDGSVWEAESPEATRELRQQKTSATSVIAMIDEIRAIRGRVGGESRLLNSTDSQRLDVLKARAKLLVKKGTQGMSSDKDLETIEEAAGTGNADSWRDQDGKLLEARARTSGELNQAFRDAKYSGPAIDFPETRPAESTLDEIKFEGLLTKPDESIDQARQQIDEARAGGFDVGYNPDASIKQQVGIARLGQEAAGPADDQTAALARTRLQKLAAEAPTSALRQLARATLESALRSGVGSTEGTTTASGARTPRGEQSVATPTPDELRLR